jgi:hypothetical protein
MYNFPSVLTVFHRFFPWIVQGDVDLCFLLILVTKANAAEWETTSATSLYHRHNQSTQNIWHDSDRFLLAYKTSQVLPQIVYAKSH